MGLSCSIDPSDLISTSTSVNILEMTQSLPLTTWSENTVNGEHKAHRTFQGTQYWFMNEMFSRMSPTTNESIARYGHHGALRKHVEI